MHHRINTPINVAIQAEDHVESLHIQRFHSPQYKPIDTFGDVDHQKVCFQKQQRQQQQKNTKPKHVSFSEVVHVNLVLHVDDMDDEEYFSTWYQGSELKRIRSAMRKTVSKMANGTYKEGYGKNETFRGLEYRTKSGANQRKFNKNMARCSVMREQTRQLFEEVRNDEALRSVYLRENHHCTKSAIAMGRLDEEDAWKIYEESPF
mmetsp:Transcript_25421/g.59091  ORF Transcript_25421/g.59091 Transcript_25421/m.59091 type:complete len:205 (+) Transcript_25421:61-675(+)